MNNRDKKEILEEFIGDMEAKGYLVIERAVDKIVFKKANQYLSTIPADIITFTKSALDDIITLVKTELD